MKYLTNPYKAQGSKDLHPIQFDVSEEDFRYMQSRLPLRGAFDKLMATLFASFVNEIKNQNIPLYGINSDNAELIIATAKRASFARATRT